LGSIPCPSCKKSIEDQRNAFHLALMNPDHELTDDMQHEFIEWEWMKIEQDIDKFESEKEDVEHHMKQLKKEIREFEDEKIDPHKKPNSNKSTLTEEEPIEPPKEHHSSHGHK